MDNNIKSTVFNEIIASKKFHFARCKELGIGIGQAFDVLKTLYLDGQMAIDEEGCFSLCCDYLQFIKQNAASCIRYEKYDPYRVNTIIPSIAWVGISVLKSVYENPASTLEQIKRNAVVYNAEPMLEMLEQRKIIYKTGDYYFCTFKEADYKYFMNRMENLKSVTLPYCAQESVPDTECEPVKIILSCERCNLKSEITAFAGESIAKIIESICYIHKSDELDDLYVAANYTALIRTPPIVSMSDTACSYIGKSGDFKNLKLKTALNRRIGKEIKESLKTGEPINVSIDIVLKQI